MGCIDSTCVQIHVHTDTTNWANSEQPPNIINESLVQKYLRFSKVLFLSSPLIT